MYLELILGIMDREYYSEEPNIWLAPAVNEFMIENCTIMQEGASVDWIDYTENWLDASDISIDD